MANHQRSPVAGLGRQPTTTQTELNDKYKELIAKINRQTHNDEVAGQGDGEECDASLNGDEESGNTNDQLKKLYDASVAFKNDLANLRGSIKTLNAKTQAYGSKCNNFGNELDQLFQMNRRLQEERKKEGPKSVSVRLELDHKHQQMKEMQNSFVGLISDTSR